jgi:hypothetical protein
VLSRLSRLVGDITVESAADTGTTFHAEYQAFGFSEILAKPYQMRELNSELYRIMTWDPSTGD